MLQLEEQLSWSNSSEGQVFSPLHPASRGQKLFSAPNNPCFKGIFLLDLSTLGMAGLRSSLIAKAVFGALRGAGCHAPGQWRDPWAAISMQIAQDLFALASFLGLCWHTAAVLLCPHPLPSFGGT